MLLLMYSCIRVWPVVDRYLLWSIDGRLAHLRVVMSLYWQLCLVPGVGTGVAVLVGRGHLTCLRVRVLHVLLHGYCGWSRPLTVFVMVTIVERVLCESRLNDSTIPVVGGGITWLKVVCGSSCLMYTHMCGGPIEVLVMWVFSQGSFSTVCKWIYQPGG